MKDELVRLTYEIELQPGEELHLPEALVAVVGPGRCRLTLQPVRRTPARSHAAFLNSYAPEDEGLYDPGIKDCPTLARSVSEGEATIPR